MFKVHIFEQEYPVTVMTNKDREESINDIMKNGFYTMPSYSCDKDTKLVYYPPQSIRKIEIV